MGSNKIVFVSLIILIVIILALIVINHFRDDPEHINPEITVKETSKSVGYIGHISAKNPWNPSKEELKERTFDTINRPSGQRQAKTLIEKGSELVINFDGNPSLEINKWDGSGKHLMSKELKENSISIPEKQGSYIYNLHADWFLGSDVYYVFKVEVN